MEILDYRMTGTNDAHRPPLRSAQSAAHPWFCPGHDGRAGAGHWREYRDFRLAGFGAAGNAPGIAAPERLVVFSRTGEGLGFGRFSYPDYCDYRDRAQSFSGLMAYRHTDFSLGGVDEPEQLRGAVVSNNYFSVLGAGAFFGPGTQHAVVLSHRLWQRRFRGDPGLVGQAIRLNGRPYTVAGIAPRPSAARSLTIPWKCGRRSIWMPPRRGRTRSRIRTKGRTRF